MVKLIYGKEIVLVNENNMVLTEEQRRILLDGKYVIDTGIASHHTNKIRKAYYLGVLFEIFFENYHPHLSKLDIYAAIFTAYPVFLNLRQAQDIVAEYYNLKKSTNVFA